MSPPILFEFVTDILKMCNAMKKFSAKNFFLTNIQQFVLSQFLDHSITYVPCFNCFPFQFRGQDYGFHCNSSLSLLSFNFYIINFVPFLFGSVKVLSEFMEEYYIEEVLYAESLAYSKILEVIQGSNLVFHVSTPSPLSAPLFPSPLQTVWTAIIF